MEVLISIISLILLVWFIASVSKLISLNNKQLNNLREIVRLLKGEPDKNKSNPT